MLTRQQQDDLDAKEAKLKADREALDKRNLEFSEREKKIKDAETAARRTSIIEFVTGLVKTGKILPRDQTGLVAYMAGPNDSGVIEFSEGDEKKTVAAADWLKTFLDGLPKQVDYAERSAADDANRQTVSFSAPPGYSVDPARLELHNKALAWQGAHPNTDYETAIAAVSK